MIDMKRHMVGYMLGMNYDASRTKFCILGSGIGMGRTISCGVRFQFVPSGVIGMNHVPVVFIGFRESDFRDELSVFAGIASKDFEFSFFNEFKDFREGLRKPVEKFVIVSSL